MSKLLLDFLLVGQLLRMWLSCVRLLVLIWGVKASGGTRSYEDAQAMIQAGANRIGTSSGVAIMKGEVAHGDY